MNKNLTILQGALLSLACGIITTIFSWGILRASTGYDKINEKVEQKADKIYVISQDERLQAQIDNKVGKDEFNIILETIKDIKTDTREIRSQVNKIQK